MDQDKIWDYFQNEGVLSFQGNRCRLKFLASKIASNDNKILNIGVGNGLLENILTKQGCKVYSLDPSVAAIEKLRKILGMDDLTAKVGYSENIPFGDNTFNVVIMSEVIEHLTNEIISKTFQEVHRVLVPGGRYIGTVPADENLKENEAVCPDCGKVFHRWGHVQSFTSNRLISILQPTFANVSVKRLYFGSWATLNWKGKFLWVLKKISVFFGINGSGESYYFVGFKNR